MKFTWISINRFLFALAAVLASLAFIMPGVLLNILNSSHTRETIAEPPVAAPKPAKKKDNSPGQIPLPTQEEINRAAAVALHRMKPPLPAPPPEPVSVPVAVPVETVLFRGSLVGVIRDNDPAFCYALLKDTDNRIHLVVRGGRLNERPDSPTVQEVNAESVVIAYGDRIQTLELRGAPQ